MAQWVRDRLHPWSLAESGLAWAPFVAMFMLSLVSRSRAHQVIAARVVERFTLAVKPLGAGTVRPAHIDAYLADLKRLDGQPASEQERAKHWRYLSMLFAFGVQRGHCAANPVTKTARPQVAETIIRAPRWGDVLALLEAAGRVRCNDAQGLYLLVLLAVVTGLRAGDLLALELGDFEPGCAETGGVGLWWGRNRKGRKVKVCGLPSAVEALVLRRVAALATGSRRLFLWPSFPDGAWNRLRVEARVAGLRFQALRRAGGALAATIALQRAGAQHLQHTGLAVFRRHYEDREQAAVVFGSSVVLPPLPPMPTFEIGTVDCRGRLRAIKT